MSYDYVCDHCGGQGATGPAEPPCPRCSGSGLSVSKAYIADMDQMGASTAGHIARAMRNDPSTCFGGDGDGQS